MEEGDKMVLLARCPRCDVALIGTRITRPGKTGYDVSVFCWKCQEGCTTNLRKEYDDEIMRSLLEFIADDLAEQIKEGRRWVSK